tara:strand:+ start:280 stop:567 length:288 start_codon:yes stop_codon:yes gene_type:complete
MNNEIELQIIEKFRGYLVVQYKDQYFRLCNFTYENNKDWDLMELVPNYYSFYHQDAEKMNKKLYDNCNYDAEHMGTYKTKKEALKSLFNYIIINK